MACGYKPHFAGTFTRHDSTLLLIGHIHLFESEGFSDGLFFYLFAFIMFPTRRYHTHHEHLSCWWCCAAHYHSLCPWISLCQHVVSLWSTRCNYWLMSSIFQNHGSHTHCLCAQLTHMSSWIVWNWKWSTVYYFLILYHIPNIKLLYGGIWQTWEGVEYTTGGESKSVITDGRKGRKCSNSVCFRTF